MPDDGGLLGGASWWENMRGQPNNRFYGKKKVRWNHEQKKEAFNKRVEKRRAKKKR
jgi:hypothetical protein